jgi:hypothetical protein
MSMQFDSTPFDRLDQYIAEDRLIRNAWTEGTDRACLLAAIAPVTGEKQEASACPSTIMPEWLARLTPWMDDRGSLDAWPGMVRRYAAVARRWHALTPADWRKLDFAARAICVREAVSHTKVARVVEVCGAVIALCDRAASGDEPTEQEWRAVAAEAEAAWRAAEAEAWRAAEAAWRAAEAEAWGAVAVAGGGAAAGGAVAEAAVAAVAWRAAEAAAEAAEAAEAAAWRAAEAAEAAEAEAAWRAAARRAADRITSAILGAIEVACARVEA